MTSPASTYWTRRVASTRPLPSGSAGGRVGPGLHRERVEDGGLVVRLPRLGVLEDDERGRPLVPVHARSPGERDGAPDPGLEPPPLQRGDEPPGVRAAGLVHRLR